MSARVIDEPLAAAFSFSDGTSYTLSLHHLPCQALVRDLARGLAAMAHPHGDVDARNTAEQYRTAIGQMSRSLDEAGHTGGAGRLTRAQLIQFWLARQPRAEQRTRLLLRSLDRQQQGLLLPEVSQYLSGPPLRRRPAPKPLTPYSPVEWDRLRLCCEKTIAGALAGQKAATALADTGRDPRPDGWRAAANQMWLLRSHGPMTTMEVAAYLGCSPKTVRTLGAPGEAARRLFPTMPAVVAFRLLLGMTSGIVPDGLEDLGLEDVDWAGNATVLLDYVKGRTRRESLNLPAEAVRVLRRWMEYSAVLRPFADQPDRSALWLAYHRSGQERVAAARFNDETMRRWARAHELAGEDGRPLILHRSAPRSSTGRTRAPGPGGPRSTRTTARGWKAITTWHRSLPRTSTRSPR